MTGRNGALTINENLLRDRWLMIGDQGRNVSPIMLGVLVSWVDSVAFGGGSRAAVASGGPSSP